MVFIQVTMTIPNNANQYLPGTIQIPSALEIASITQSYPMVVTATIDMETQANTYIAGQLVRFFIPYTFGMWQLNGLTGEILSVNNLVFTIDIDSRLFDAFSIPNPNLQGPASFSPAGSRNLSFSNITNKVGFQSLNDRGN